MRDHQHRGTGPRPAAHVTTEIQIVLPATAVLDASNEPGSITVGSHGPQPVTAQAVRDLLDDPDTPTTLRRLLTDPVLRDRVAHLRRHGPPAPDPGRVI